MKTLIRNIKTEKLFDLADDMGLKYEKISSPYVKNYGVSTIAFTRMHIRDYISQEVFNRYYNTSGFSQLRPSLSKPSERFSYDVKIVKNMLSKNKTNREKLKHIVSGLTKTQKKQVMSSLNEKHKKIFQNI